MTAAEKLFYKIGNAIEDSIQSQMFGWPCFKIDKTAFISFENDCMVFKLPAYLIEDAMQLPNAYIFKPNKKTVMKNWVCIPYAHKKLWKHYALEALKFIIQ
jgi:hypothetical protein